MNDPKEQRIDISTLEREIRAIESAASDFEVGVCHNDITGINIIYNRETGEFSFIDFEYCCLNYVAFDVGNLFCEYVGYTKDRSLYPSEEEQTAFIRAYLSARTDLEVTEESVERFKHQVRICAMLSNLHWCIWGIIQAKYSTIDFDYWEYAEERLGWYYEMKARYGFQTTDQELV